MMENNNSSFVLEYFVGEIMGTRWKPSLFFQFVPCHNLFCLGGNPSTTESKWGKADSIYYEPIFSR